MDNAGFYYFEQVPLGTFTLVAKAPVGADAGSVTATVAFEGDVGRADIQFVGTGTVMGTVTTGTGAPATYRQVRLVRKGTVGQYLTLESQTDSDGQFRFDAILVGEISVSAKQAVTNLAGAASGDLTKPGGTLALNIVLEPAGSVQGRVLREDGQYAGPADGPGAGQVKSRFLLRGNAGGRCLRL